MNERIRELMIKSNAFDYYEINEGVDGDELPMVKFAELIVKECAENFTKVWYEQGMDIRGAELDKFMKRFNEHFGVKE